MVGAGRKFNKEEFEVHAKKLIYCIVSNINFPEIKVRFMTGNDLLKDYPKGVIPRNKHNKFFA